MKYFSKFTIVFMLVYLMGCGLLKPAPPILDKAYRHTVDNIMYMRGAYGLQEKDGQLYGNCMSMTTYLKEYLINAGISHENIKKTHFDSDGTTEGHVVLDVTYDGGIWRIDPARRQSPWYYGPANN